MHAFGDLDEPRRDEPESSVIGDPVVGGQQRRVPTLSRARAASSSRPATAYNSAKPWWAERRSPTGNRSGSATTHSRSAMPAVMPAWARTMPQVVRQTDLLDDGRVERLVQASVHPG